MKIQILGTGCPKCRALESSAHQAVQQLSEISAESSDLGKTYNVEKVQDMDDIMNFGVMITPALAINGNLVSEGKLLSKDQVIELIQNHWE